MSEKYRQYEKALGAEKHIGTEGLERKLASEVNERAERGAENSHERIEAARKSVEQEAISRENVDAALSEQSQKDTTEVRWWSSELKAQTLDRTLSSVRKRLSTPEKKLSQFIHIRAVETISDATGKTIARPSGLLIGSICAFIGSLVSYVVARRIGGELSPSVGLIFFVGGFAIGILGEAIVFAYRKTKLRRSLSKASK